MKNKIVAICGIVCILLTACVSGEKSFTIKLDDFKNEASVFCYKGLSWGISADATSQALSLDLGEAITATVDQGDLPSFVSGVYYPPTEIKLFNTGGKGSFEYRDDQLTSLVFTFRKDSKDIESFRKKVMDKLIKLYSDEYTSEERTADEGSTVINTYTWSLPDGEGNSHIQMVIVEKERFATLNIGTFPSKK